MPKKGLDQSGVRGDFKITDEFATRKRRKVLSPCYGPVKSFYIIIAIAAVNFGNNRDNGGGGLLDTSYP